MKKNRKISPEDKLAIVLQYVARTATAQDLCRKYGIDSYKTIYNWLARLKASASLVFQDQRGAKRGRSLKALPVQSLEADFDTDSVSPDAFNDELTEAREVAKLLGVTNTEIKKMEEQVRQTKRRDESRRGRMSLKRAVKLNQKKKAGADTSPHLK